MLTWFFVLPIVGVVSALLAGYCLSAKRFLVGLLLWWGLWAAVAYVLGWGLIPTLLCIAMGLLGVTPIVFLSVCNKKTINPSPAEQGYEAVRTAAKAGYQAYTSLPQERKEKIHQGAKTAAKMGLRYLADRFQGSGKTAEAKLFRSGSKFL
jgi:hypothetical protein